MDRKQNTWKEAEAFAAYGCSYDVLSTDTKKKKDVQRNYFFELMWLQIRKHNGHYLKGILILLIEGQDPTPNVLHNNFVSAIQKTTLDLIHLYSFLKDKVNLDEINSIKGSVNVKHISDTVYGTV